jgi:shikimate kinase
LKRGIIILLIGQKGSGKSYIGSLLETQFNIKFIRVEDWAKDVKQSRNIDDETYLDEVFKAIEIGVKHKAVNYNSVCFESTGLTHQFDKMLENLKKEFNVVTIKIVCDPGVCIKRIKSRDQNIHINVSDDEVSRINFEVTRRNYKTDFELRNNAKSKNELIKELGMILKNISVNIPDIKFERI